MGEFTKIARSFWETDEARDMTPEEKYFWLYLRTNANVNTLGCYVFRMRRAMDETGYNRETLEKLLCRMVEQGYISYCAETGEILLLGWGAENWTKGTAVKRAVAADLKNVQSAELSNMLLGLLDGAGLLPLLPQSGGKNAGSGCEATGQEDSEGQAWTAEDSEGQAGTTLAEKEKGKEKEKEKILSANSPEFAAFWDAYPNRKNKQTAIKAWNRLKITPEKHRAIMAGLERAKTSVEWTKDGGEFIPHPATWLNAGGWENEYKPLRPSGDCISAPQKPPLRTAPENDPLARRRKLAEGVDRE